MYNSKLLQLLQRMEEGEWRSLGRFLRSPYHNTNKKLVELHGLLLRYYPDFTDTGLDKEKVFAKLFGKTKAFDEKQLANLMSQFNKSTNRFFMLRQLEEKPLLEQRLLGEYYAERNWYDLYKKNTERLLEKFKAQKVKSSEDNFNAFLVNLNFYHHQDTPKVTGNVPHLEGAIEALTNLSILGSLRLGLETTSRKYYLSDEIDFPLLPHIKNLAKKNKEPLSDLYLSLLEVFTENDPSKYEDFKQLFLSNLDLLTEAEQEDIFSSLINLANRISNTEKRNSLHFTLFELYKEGLKNNLLIVKNKMGHAHFSNIILVAIKNKKLTWAKKFIDAHEKFLYNKERKIVSNYCKARIFYEERKFESAVDLLREVDNSPHSFSFNVKGLYIRSLFELFLKKDSYYDLLISKIEAFKKYIKRNKTWNENKKKPYLHFCKFTYKLTDAIVRSDKDLLQKINDELEIQPVIAKNWLASMLKIQ